MKPAITNKEKQVVGLEEINQLGKPNYNTPDVGIFIDDRCK
jgi:hypothetical protein